MSRATGNYKALRLDERGSTIIEFAIILPVFFTFIFGIFDLGYAVYNNAILEGATQAAGRASTLAAYSQDQSALDATVADRVHDINPGADVTFQRKSYASFNRVNASEEWTDKSPFNGIHDNGECFFDENGNGTFDEDVGKANQGGAKDVTNYIVNVRYKSIFPLWRMIGGSEYRELQASTVLRNQPYSQQGGRQSVKVCT